MTQDGEEKNEREENEDDGEKEISQGQGEEVKKDREGSGEIDPQVGLAVLLSRAGKECQSTCWSFGYRSAVPRLRLAKSAAAPSRRLVILARCL